MEETAGWIGRVLRRAEPKASELDELSEDGRLGVGAVDALERFDDLAFGAVGAGAVEQWLHQVAAARGVVPELGERLVCGVAVAAGFDRLGAAGLPSPELGPDPQ